MLCVFLPRVTSRLEEVASLSSVSQPCISHNLMEVTKAICNLAPNYIQFPRGEELLRIKEEFLRQSGMPGVLGLIDGSLFPIKAPSGPNEPAYVCRKGYHAINVQAIGDQNMVIRHKLLFYILHYRLHSNTI